MVYLSRYGFAQTHYLKYRLRLTHRKRKKGNWMSLSPPPLLLKIGYFWSIKLRWGRWKNYLMTNFLGWELFPSGGSTVGTLGPCILLNVPKVGHPTVYRERLHIIHIGQFAYRERLNMILIGQPVWRKRPNIIHIGQPVCR